LSDGFMDGFVVEATQYVDNSSAVVSK